MQRIRIIPLCLYAKYDADGGQLIRTKTANGANKHDVLGVMCRLALATEVSPVSVAMLCYAKLRKRHQKANKLNSLHVKDVQRIIFSINCLVSKMPESSMRTS